jgi:hypothetical protein
VSEFDPTAATGGHSEGSRARTTGGLERGAADAIGPILERTLAELGLGPLRAQLLMRQIAEAYMRGRAEGITLAPHQADRALSAEGIAIALALQEGPLGPPPGRPGAGAAERRALEAMARGIIHTVTVEAAVGWDDPEHLAHLLAALAACPESVGPPVGGHVRRRVIGVTLTLRARTEKAAQEIATRALIDEMVKLGLV